MDAEQPGAESEVFPPARRVRGELLVFGGLLTLLLAFAIFENRRAATLEGKLEKTRQELRDLKRERVLDGR